MKHEKLYDDDRPFDIPLGAEVKDEITGFTGRVLGVLRWITGCDQYFVKPPVDINNKERDGCYFDADRLKIMDTPILELPGAARAKSKTPFREIYAERAGEPARRTGGPARSNLQGPVRG